MPFQFNINTDAAVVFTNKLEKLHRSALPNAVRGTLNSMAFDVKKKTMPQNIWRFKRRERNFFKANSSVEVAKGFDMDSMHSTVGFFPNNKIGNKKAVEDLEQQEHGGVIKGRKYIPTEKARVSKNKNKRISKKNRLGEIGIKNIVRTKNAQGTTEGQRFSKSVIHAGKGGFVQSEFKGRTMVWKVKSLKRGANGQFKLSAVYIVNDSKKIRVTNATHFMERASKRSAKKGDHFFSKEAKRQFEKHLR